MNEFILNTDPPSSKRVRLSREELLAGKCFPDENSFSLDPRLRSPDDILAQRAQRMPSAAPSAAQTSIAALQKRYEAEIQGWRNYEVKVLEWKNEVTAILEQYKAAAQEKEIIVQELLQAQEKIKKQEQDLAWFRQQLTIPTATTL